VAIFELDADRAVAVQAMEPAPGAVGAQVEQIIEQRLGELLGERLLTVARGRAGHDEPFLLALDGVGGVVVTEIVTNLDAATLASALVRAGHASRLGDAELAQRYHRGPQAFVDDRAELFTSVPEVVRGERRPGGTRLVVVCAAVALDALDALEFLRQPGHRVEVLRVGVLRGTDGRRVLDVSPLGLGGRGPRGLEPTAPEQAPATTAPQVTRTSVLEPQSPVDHEAERRRMAAMVSTQALPAVTDPHDEQVSAYAGPVHAQPAHQAPAARAAAPARPQATPARPQVADPVSPARVAVGVTQAPSRAVQHPRPYQPKAAPETTGAVAHPAGYAGARYRARLASVEEVSIDTNPNDLSSLRDSSRSFAAAMAYGEPVTAPAEVLDDAPPLADPDPADDVPSSYARGPEPASYAAPERYADPEPAPYAERYADPGSYADDARAGAPYAQQAAPRQAAQRPGPYAAPYVTDPASHGSSYASAPHGSSYAANPSASSYAAAPYVSEPAAPYASAQRPAEPPAQAPKGPRDPALAALAARLDGPAPLVWVRHRRGETIHATLFTDGVLELADGQRFWSADLAACAAVGASGVDGWRMWRLGDETGPTLAECR